MAKGILEQAMGEAFDDACKALRDTGQPQIVRDVIAGRIIESARLGERDPQRLCDYALAGVPRRAADAALQPGNCFRIKQSFRLSVAPAAYRYWPAW